ncbi:MAG: two-component system, cell cycle response regulator [Thermoleophilaceae bacterium]|nr:two-component system, cell cycle response regulator [Thermoleophilaceae bacterium]
MAFQANRDDGYGWLCPTPGHRARMLDMGARAKRARVVAMGAVAVGLLATIPNLGWATAVLATVAVLNLASIDFRIARSERPERAVAGSGVLIILVIGAGGAMTGGGLSPALMWLVLPVAVLATRFRSDAVWAFAGFAALVAVATATVGGAGETIRHPLQLMAVLVMIIGVTAVVTALMDAELQFRSESALDALTGLLNRTGLEARFAEVAEQARMLGRPVCLVLCDLDNFKSVNDEYGHERGDVVLREVSEQMRASLRSFELFYRLGGEEFLLLLPGIDLPAGVEMAEALRLAVAGGHPGGIEISASLGVTAAIGDELEFLTMYKAADEALYRAKHAGRNAVRGARRPGALLAAQV